MKKGRLAPLVWTGLLLASTLLVSGCKQEPSGDDSRGASAASAATERTPHTGGPTPSTRSGAPRRESTAKSAEAVAINLPSPPKPPELRDAKEQVDAGKILTGYGFPSHESLTPLCGWRDFNPGGTTWVVDLFASPLSVTKLRQSYEQRLGQEGLKNDTWSIPASGTVQRQLSLLAPADLEKYTRCQVPMPADAKTLVVARRAQ